VPAGGARRTLGNTAGLGCSATRPAEQVATWRSFPSANELHCNRIVSMGWLSSGHPAPGYCRLCYEEAVAKRVEAFRSAQVAAGMGTSYHPLPWNQLTYEPAQGGYVVDLTREQLEGAPIYSASDIPAWTDPSHSRGIDDYYASVGGRR
jgi:hypothetical protein